MTTGRPSIPPVERWLPSRTSEAQAQAWFARMRFGWWGRIRRGLVRGGCLANRPARLQLTGLPCAEVTVRLSECQQTSGRLALRVWGHGQGVERVREAPVGKPAGGGPGQAFDYPLTEAATLELARQALTRLKLSRVLGPYTSRELCLVLTDVSHYPFWVGYYERRGGWVDVVMLDAVTGKRAGSLMRRGLLDALAARRDTERD